MAIRLTEKELEKVLSSQDYAVSADMSEEPRGMTEAHKALVRNQTQRLESKFLAYWLQCGGSETDWERNYRFDLPDSRMELDFAMPERKIAVEVNGGQALGSNSGHGNWSGLERDARKQNACVRKGWKLYWFPTSMVNFDEVQRLYNELREN